MTLGELLKTLEGFDADDKVLLGSRPPGYFHSYRGYYDHLALTPGDDPMTVGELVRECHNAMGATFEGWKGGDFAMSDHTPVWASEEGTNSGIGIVGVALDIPNTVRLITADISDYGS